MIIEEIKADNSVWVGVKIGSEAIFREGGIYEFCMEEGASVISLKRGKKNSVYGVIFIGEWYISVC